MDRIKKMIMVITMLLLVGLTSASAIAGQSPSENNGEHWHWGNTVDAESRQIAMDAIRSAVTTRDFARLDALAILYRGPAGTTPSGGSLLDFYYEVLAYEVRRSSDAASCDADGFAILDQWREASPRSPVPIIAKAALLEQRGWCYRGSGLAKTVDADAWGPYRKNIAAAFALMDQSKSIASADPYYYVQLIGLYVASGQSRARFAKLLDEAATRFPYHYEIYFAAYRYNQPKWYGGPAEIDALARYMIEKTQARDGNGAYARFYWNIYACGCYSDIFAADGAIMLPAIDDWADRYPVDTTYIHIAQLSCWAGDVDRARKYLAMLTINLAGAWKAKEWEKCRALIGPSSEPLPLGSS